MFDLFGVNKADSKDAIREMAHGVTLGLLDGYEWRLREKEEEIKALKENIANNEKWEQRYNELSSVLEMKRKEQQPESP